MRTILCGRERDTVVDNREAGQQVGIALEKLCEADHDVAPFVGGHPPPDRRGMARGRNCGIDFRRASEGDGACRLAGRGIDVRVRPAAGIIDLAVSDEESSLGKQIGGGVSNHGRPLELRWKREVV
jgi:hypothetical protein